VLSLKTVEGKEDRGLLCPQQFACGLGASVQVGDEFPVGRACRIEFLIALFELVGEVDDLLLEGGDAVLELVDIGGGAGCRLAPRVLAEKLG
jgi:hypothetical protein